MGSAAAASWIAHGAFWALLVYGWACGELGHRSILAFLLLWVAAFLGLAWVPWAAGMFPSYVAALDIALVFVIFKGDVRLT